jgi:hypothetical protein
MGKTIVLVKSWNVLASTQEAPRAVSEQVSCMSCAGGSDKFPCPTPWDFSVFWHFENYQPCSKVGEIHQRENSFKKLGWCLMIVYQRLGKMMIKMVK